MAIQHTTSHCCAHHEPVDDASPHSHGPGKACDSRGSGSEDGLLAKDALGNRHGLTSPAARARQRRALAWCFWLTLVTMIAEVIGGLVTGSLMLLSDAAHMASHAVALAVSWGAIWMSTRPRTERSHYGLFRAEILGALLNALGLLALTGWIVYEAIERFASPVDVLGPQMIVVAAVGLVVNVITAWILIRAGAEDLNTKSALLHMLGDLFSSAVILVGGLVLMQTGWVWIDPLLSLVIAVVILWWGWGLLKASCSILLERAPEGVEPAEVQQVMCSEPRVLDVHDLHVWEITNGYICLTAHVVVDENTRVSETSALREAMCALLWKEFRVAHVTLQMESEAGTA